MLSLLKLSICCLFASEGTTHTNTFFIFWLLQLLYLHYSTWFVWLPLPMQRTHHTLLYKPPTLLLVSSYLLPLHSPHPLMFLAISLYLLFPTHDSLRVLQWNAEDLRARRAELIHLSPLILWILSVVILFRNPILTHLSFSGSLDSLFCNLMAHSQSGIFFPMTNVVFQNHKSRYFCFG